MFQHFLKYMSSSFIYFVEPEITFSFKRPTHAEVGTESEREDWRECEGRLEQYKNSVSLCKDCELLLFLL